MRKFSAIVKVFLISILLSVNSFADDFRKPESYMPGGEYRLFGSGRGSVSNVTGEYHETGNFAINAGNVAINNSSYEGHYEYQQNFSGHGHEVHAPFSSSNSKIGLNKTGRPEDGLKISAIYVRGTEVHPANGYDGSQGGSFPAPTGARDHCSYGISGSVVTVKVVSIEKLNQFLPPEQKITKTDRKKLQNGEKLSDERYRELYATVEKSNPTEVPWNALPKPISAQLGKEASDGENLFWKTIVDGAKFTAEVGIAAGATVAEAAVGSWNAVSHPISTLAGIGNTLAEEIWNVGESSYGLYKSENKLDYFYNGTVENFNTISGKISDKIEDTKANAAACGDDYVCKGAIYGKPATDTTAYLAAGVGGAKTLGTVGRNFSKSVDNLAEWVGKSSPTEAQKARQIDINTRLDGEMVYSRGVNFSTERIPPNIHQGKQDKHDFGSNNYTESRSYIHNNINAQELLDGVHTGQYPVVSVGNRNMPVVDNWYCQTIWQSNKLWNNSLWKK